MRIFWWGKVIGNDKESTSIERPKMVTLLVIRCVNIFFYMTAYCYNFCYFYFRGEGEIKKIWARYQSKILKGNCSGIGYGGAISKFAGLKAIVLCYPLLSLYTYIIFLSAVRVIIRSAMLYCILLNRPLIISLSLTCPVVILPSDHLSDVNLTHICSQLSAFNLHALNLPDVNSHLPST